jgi:glucosamine--fructose-6-phosphate aminotransferase (isomerizing)
MIRQRFLRHLYKQVVPKNVSWIIGTASRPVVPNQLQRRFAVSVAASVSSSSSTSEQVFATSRCLTATALAALVTMSVIQNEKERTDCCGIVGVVGTKQHSDAREFLLDGLTILKNRGYDSAGIATVPPQGGEMSITKYASDGDKADSIELVDHHSPHLGHTLGIAHTRWYVG